MQTSLPSQDLQTRLDNLIAQITKVVFTNVCRGLFEAHKLIFSFLIATSIDRQYKLIQQDLWSVFLRGSGFIDKTIHIPNPDSNIISDLAWDFAIFLQ